MFCDTSLSVFLAFCQVAPSLCRPIHMALVYRAQHEAMWFFRNLGAPFWRSWGDPRVAPRFLCSKVCLGRLCPGDVMWIPADRTNVERENWLRTLKDEMDVATGRTWTSYEWSCGAWHARDIYQRSIGRSSWTTDLFPGMPSICRPMHSRRQCSPMSPMLVTEMDKICGWSEEEHGWDLYLQPVCGSTPNACCVMDRKPRRTS